MRIAQEEIFGTVIGVMRVQTWMRRLSSIPGRRLFTWGMEIKREPLIDRSWLPAQ